MSPKPQPWYAKFNQPPRSPNGRNWKPSAPTHRDPTDRTDRSPRADPADDYTIPIRTSLPTATWRAFKVTGGIALFPNPFDSKPSPPPIPYAGVRAGEIIGHRMWLVLDNNQLYSLAHYFLWEPGATIEGKVDEEVEGRVWHFLGPIIYGGVYSYADSSFITPELLGEGASFPRLLRFDTFGPPYACFGIAVGTIKCWGEVIEHEKGYRAQYAKLHSIDFVVGAADLQTLRTKYHV